MHKPSAEEKEEPEFKRFSEFWEFVRASAAHLMVALDSLTGWRPKREAERVVRSLENSGKARFYGVLLFAAALASIVRVNAGALGPVWSAFLDLDLPGAYGRAFSRHSGTIVLTTCVAALFVAGISMLVAKLVALKSEKSDRSMLEAEVQSVIVLISARALIRLTFVGILASVPIDFIIASSGWTSRLATWCSVLLFVYLYFVPILAIARVSKLRRWPLAFETSAAVAAGVVIFYVWVPIGVFGAAAPWARVHVSVCDYPRLSFESSGRLQMVLRVSVDDFDRGALYLGLADRFPIRIAPAFEGRFTKNVSSNVVRDSALEIRAYDWTVDGKAPNAILELDSKRGVILTLSFGASDLKSPRGAADHSEEARKSLDHWPTLAVNVPLTIYDEDLHGVTHTFALSCRLPNHEHMREAKLVAASRQTQ